MAASLGTFIRHLWLDADDAKRQVGPKVLEQLTQLVAASESRHSGEIRICIEASLPLSDLWRVGPALSLAQLTRERAVSMFGQLRVWDTELNNGVLIYVLLAEHAIEIVADRGLNARISASQWSALVLHMTESFRQGDYEGGMTHALEHISAALMQQFALPLTEPGGHARINSNELPDAPTLL